MGELQVRGPWVAASYFDAPEAAGCWTEDGWFRTGDVVTIDAEGYVNIADRTKDLIKSGGEWISSVALENALMGHPSVREAAVIAIPDEKWGERPLAVIVFKEGKTVEDAALREHLSATFPKWALPDRFVARAEIPRTSTGKFLKSKLREELGQTPNRS
jgi:fatty-acyl-CoA synthase